MTNVNRAIRILVGIGGLLVAAVTPGAALAQQAAAPPAIEITLLHVKPGQEGGIL